MLELQFPQFQEKHDCSRCQYTMEQSRARFEEMGIMEFGWFECEEYFRAGSYPAEDFILWAAELGWSPEQH